MKTRLLLGLGILVLLGSLAVGFWLAQAPGPHPSEIVEGLGLGSPFVYYATVYDEGPFKIIETYWVSDEDYAPTSAFYAVLKELVALDYTNEKEEWELESGSEDQMNSAQAYLSGYGKRIQLLVGWAEPGTDALKADPRIYVMIGEYR